MTKEKLEYIYTRRQVGLRPTRFCYTDYIGHSDYLLIDNVKWMAKHPTWLCPLVLLCLCSPEFVYLVLCSLVLRFSGIMSFVYLALFLYVSSSSCFSCYLVLIASWRKRPWGWSPHTSLYYLVPRPLVLVYSFVWSFVLSFFSSLLQCPSLFLSSCSHLSL